MIRYIALKSIDIMNLKCDRRHLKRVIRFTLPRQNEACAGGIRNDPVASSPGKKLPFIDAAGVLL
jgi:hypothetical protein